MQFAAERRFATPCAAPRATASAPDALQAGMMARVLDEIDHGLLMVDLTGRILHANYPARRELAAECALCDDDGMLGSRHAVWQQLIRQALQDAGRDCRSIVELGHATDPLSLAFIPIAALHGGTVDTVLVMCSKRQTCATLTMQMFARAKRLTRAEQDVLKQLCAGHRAEEIAGLQGICISTVRTHIKSVREKTGSNSIGEIVHRISRMPQVVSALRLAPRE